MLDDADEEDEQEEIIGQRWSGKKKIMSSGHGYSDEGGKFYYDMCYFSRKKFELDEWAGLWTE